MKHKLACVLAGMLLMGTAACGLRSADPEAFLARRGIAAADRPVTVCTGFGCARLGRTELSETELAGLDALFSPRPATAAQERRAAASAVAYLEETVGRRVGTAGDLARNRRDHASSGQLDCIAEAANTTVYLLLLERRGLLALHSVAPPDHRGGTVFTAHNTAVLRERGGGEFAVDSWFHANGQMPEVVALEQWRQGYQPTDAGIHSDADMHTDGADVPRTAGMDAATEKGDGV